MTAVVSEIERRRAGRHSEGIAIAASDRTAGAAFTVDGPEGVRHLLLSLASRLQETGDRNPGDESE